MTPLFPQLLLDVNEEIICDLFAGGGGASLGIEMATGRQVDVAINHDAAAVSIHKANHPQTAHHVVDVFEADPRAVTQGRPIGLLWASPDCFPAGTLILTDRGYRPIEDVRRGDWVLTHEGRYRVVTETMRSRRQLVKVVGQGHPGLLVSREHPIYERRASNTWKNDERRYVRSLAPAQWTRASDVSAAPAPMNSAGGDLSFWATPCVFPAIQIPGVMGRSMTINADLMWLAGRYVGDGWTRFTGTRAEVVITCAKTEAAALRRRLNRWPRAGARAAAQDELAWYERDTKTAHQFTTNHRGLVEWLRTEFGHGADAKAFPAWAFGMREDLRQALLDGYLSADGHSRWISGSKVFAAQTVSKALAFSLRALAESLGSTAHVTGPYPNREVIEGRRVQALPVWNVKWRADVRRAQNVRDGIHNWTRIQAVETDSRFTEVFNLSVEEDESYIAEGVVVHNCTDHSKAKGGKPIRTRKRRALAWVVKRWAGQVRPRVIALENVEEFEDWGPLVGPPGALRRDARRKGKTFRRFVRSLEQLGYVVEWRELRACDYGAPTIRKRLFLIARCDGRAIVWPEPTHGDPNAAIRADSSKRRHSGEADRGRAASGGSRERSGLRDAVVDAGQADRDPERSGLPADLHYDEGEAGHADGAPDRLDRRERDSSDGPALESPGWGEDAQRDHEPRTHDRGSEQRPRAASGALGAELRPEERLREVVGRAGGGDQATEVGRDEIRGGRGAIRGHGDPRQPDHARDGQKPKLKPYLTAASCIDWSIPMLSIFATREEAKAWGRAHGRPAPIRPLAEATMRRIARGVMKYVVNAKRPFIVKFRKDAVGNSIDEPLRTVTANGFEKRPGGSVPLGLVAPIVAPITHHDEQRGQAADQPLRTITGAPRGEQALVAPFLKPRYGEREGQEPRVRDLQEPYPAVVATGNGGDLVAAHLSAYYGLKGDESRGYDAGEPIRTVTADPRHAVVSAFLAKNFGGTRPPTGSGLGEPKGTVTTIDHDALVAGHLSKFQQNGDGTPLEEPAHTVMAGAQRHGLVSSFLQKYHGQGTGTPSDEPVGTLTTKDRMGLVTVDLEGEPFVIVDIAMRMLQPRELYRAQGFPDSYEIEVGADGRRLTKTEQVRQVGNSVSPPVACAIVRANCPELVARDEVLVA